MKSYDIFQLSFFHWQNNYIYIYIFEHQHLSKKMVRHVPFIGFQKKLKIDNFQRCISDHFQ